MPEALWANAARTLGHIVYEDGRVVVIEPSMPTEWAAFVESSPSPFVPVSLPSSSDQDALLHAFRTAVDAHVDAKARAWDFNSAAHIASYYYSTVPQWRAEARAFIPWRDAVWISAIEALAQVTAGEAPIPESPAAFITALPAITRPEAPYPED